MRIEQFCETCSCESIQTETPLAQDEHYWPNNGTGPLQTTGIGAFASGHTEHLCARWLVQPYLDPLANNHLSARGIEANGWSHTVLQHHCPRSNTLDKRAAWDNSALSGGFDRERAGAGPTVTNYPTVIFLGARADDCTVRAMTSKTRLGIQGFAFGLALTGGGCMPQNQDEIAQLRADLTALKAEVATLKGETTAPSSTADAAQAALPQTDGPTAPGAHASNDAEADSASTSDANWEEALEKHDKEERDAAWSRLREPDLFTAAKAHIKLYGASLNGVRCKTTSCLITINLPKNPKTDYVPLANPWAQTEALAHAKPIYSGRTLWSYLLTRHEKDTKEAGAARVNPMELAEKNPELVRPTVLVASDTTETKVATKASPTKSADAAKPAATALPNAKPTASPTAKTTQTSTTAKPDAAKPAEADKAQAATVASKPEATPAAAKPADAAKATSAAKPVEPAKAPEAKSAAKPPAQTTAKQANSQQNAPAAGAAAQTTK